MQREGYRVTAEYEERHWWFRARRTLVLAQVGCAAREVTGAGRGHLRILDYGCGTGFTLRFLARFGEVVGAETADAALYLAKGSLVMRGARDPFVAALDETAGALLEGNDTDELIQTILAREGHTPEALHRIEHAMLDLLRQAKPDAVVGASAH